MTIDWADWQWEDEVEEDIDFRVGMQFSYGVVARRKVPNNSSDNKPIVKIKRIEKHNSSRMIYLYTLDDVYVRWREEKVFKKLIKKGIYNII